jgi:hypothetical protein
MRLFPLSPSIKIKIHNTPILEDLESKHWPEMKKLRPGFLQPLRSGHVFKDAIRYYGACENDLVERLMFERAKNNDATTRKKGSKFLGQRSTSAFVTFKNEKSSSMASQLLLHSAVDTTMLKIAPAPPLNQILWPNLTLPEKERIMRYYAIAMLSLFLSACW